MSDLPQAKGIKKTSRVAIVTVLLTLFALPIVAYLFFLNGEHHFKKLPVVTQKIGSISQFEVLHGDPAKLEGHVTLVNFLGNQPYKRLGYVSNLNEKIYKKFHEFKDFQMVSVVDYRGSNDVAQIIEQMKATTDLTDWHFIAGSPAQIEQFFKTFGTPFPLNKDNSSDLVYIIDKDANLRGRTQDEKMDDGHVYGYESATAAGLNERMVDDMRVLLAEYRLAFKKNRDQRIQEDE